MIVLIFIQVVERLFSIYYYILLARVLMSWFPNLDPTHPVVVFLYRATEPVLRPIRRLMPAGSIMDFSPLIVFLLLPLVKQLVLELIFMLIR